MRVLLALALSAGLLATACGGGDDDGAPTADPDASFMDTSAPQLDDTRYVATLCDSIEGYMEVINTRAEAEIRAARDAFEANLRALHPPEGTQDFHRNFVQYLVGARSDPTLVVTADPPLPTGELRARLASAEAEADCQFPLFARTDPQPTATPGG